MKRRIKKYRIQPFHSIEKGKPVKRFLIISTNGKEVAQCKTESFAQRCAKALEDLDNSNNTRLVGGMRV